MLCPLFFVVDKLQGTRYPCPGGTYGNKDGLETAACSRQCGSGEYCPLGSNLAAACETPAFFCPGEGQLFPTSEGYESVRQVGGKGYHEQRIWYATSHSPHDSCYDIVNSFS